MIKYFIPDKGEEFVNKWAEKIEPLLMRNGKLVNFNNKSHHFNQAFTWASDDDIIGKVQDLQEVGSFETFHTFGYYGMFKPSVAEVIQQIPEELLSEVDYFYIEGPETVYDLNKNAEALNAGFHVAKTTLYSRL